MCGTTIALNPTYFIGMDLHSVKRHENCAQKNEPTPYSATFSP